MDPKKILTKAQGKKIILDFDGVITHLKVDWETLKEDLRSKLGISENLDLGRIYLYSRINNKHSSYIKIVEEHELKGLNLDLISPLFKLIKSSKIEFSVCSSNSKKAVSYFLSKQGLGFVKIMAVDDVVFIKPHPEAVFKLIDQNPKEFIFIGDSINDKIAANLAGVKYLKYEF